MNPTIKQAACKDCAVFFDFEAYSFDPTYVPEICDDCTKRLEAIQAEEQKAKEEAEHLAFRKRAWEQMTPARYRRTAIEHPEFLRDLWNRVSKWKPTEEKPWLGIVGEAGLCKTRISTLRLEQAMIDEEYISRWSYGRGSSEVWERSSARATCPHFITSYQFAENVLAQYSDERKTKAEAKEFLNRCREAEWLVFDDIGKARNSPAVVAALFALIDHRHSSDGITIWTSNSPPEDFCKGMGLDIEGPLVRRLTELSTLIRVR